MYYNDRKSAGKKERVQKIQRLCCLFESSPQKKTTKKKRRHFTKAHRLPHLCRNGAALDVMQKKCVVSSYYYYYWSFRRYRFLSKCPNILYPTRVLSFKQKSQCSRTFAVKKMPSKRVTLQLRVTVFTKLVITTEPLRTVSFN